MFHQKFDITKLDLWWENKSFEELVEIRAELMKWISNTDTKKGLNGKVFLNKCVELGADEERIDYN